MSRQFYNKKQRLTVMGEKNVNLEFEIDEEHVTFFNERGDTDFVFKNRNEREVLEYWREVIKCMDMACVFAIAELDKNRVIGLPCLHPKGQAKAETQRVPKPQGRGQRGG